LEKIRNSNIAPRRRSTPLQAQSKNAPKKRAGSGGAKSAKQRTASPKAAGPKPFLLPFLASLVALLLAANLYFLFADPRVLPARPGTARPEGSGQTMLAAVAFPGLNATSAPAGEKSANASAIEYSTDIDDLTGYSVIVNKSRLLSPDYAPADLEYPDVPFAKGKMQLRREAALAYRAMQRAALADGARFDFYSGYRDYDFQKRIWNNSIKANGQDWATAYVAPPGASEHQTGLAVDVSCAETGQQLEESFADTPSGRWLAAHCSEYGFILRYPKGKESASGYSYEPWHFRYLGHALARAVSESGLILEEFMARAR
jgi:D-alanyl-D-alanine carboxypeptidase